MSAAPGQRFVTRNESQTLELGRRLAALLRPGDVVALVGELGAGKTRFVRGVAAGLGIDPDRTHSPTYVLANVYENDRGLRLTHVDAYRLSGAGELEELGWDRLDDGESIVIVEWADRLGEAVAKDGNAIRVQIEHLGPEERSVSIAFPDARVVESLHLAQ